MTVFNEVPKRPAEKEIFKKDINMLVKENYPEHEGQHPLFKLFGTRTGGFYDTWLYTKDWQNLPEIDKWKYVALCALYWEKMYKYWYDMSEYRQYLKYLQDNGLMEQYNYLRGTEKDDN